MCGARGQAPGQGRAAGMAQSGREVEDCTWHPRLRRKGWAPRCAVQEQGLAPPGPGCPGGSTPLSFHINKTYNRFLANWQEKCV